VGGSYPRGVSYPCKIEKPKEVDHTKLKSTLTTDGVLVVEASMPPATLNLRKSSGQGSQSPASSTRSSANHNSGSGGGGLGGGPGASVKDPEASREDPESPSRSRIRGSRCRTRDLMGGSRPSHMASFV